MLIDMHEVARMLNASWRSVLRWADAGRIPKGCKLGSLRRWVRAEIECFIEGGCKPVRTAGKGVR
jgi:predicted DNA-binding transcriptional regulator AlpA